MIRLTRIDPILNMSRYYQIHIQPCLFGGCDLVREWGRIGSPGTVKTVIYDNQADAAAAVADAAARARLSHHHVMPSRCRTFHLDFASSDAQPARFSAGATA